MLFGYIRQHYHRAIFLTQSISFIQAYQYHTYRDETKVFMLMRLWIHQSLAGTGHDKDMPMLQDHTQTHIGTVKHLLHKIFIIKLTLAISTKAEPLLLSYPWENCRAIIKLSFMYNTHYISLNCIKEYGSRR